MEGSERVTLRWCSTHKVYATVHVMLVPGGCHLCRIVQNATTAIPAMSAVLNHFGFPAAPALKPTC